jgi:hypothetical protein
MNDVVALLERAEASAFADLYAVAPPEAGARVRHAGGALVIAADALPVVTFNRAFAIEAPPSAAVLDALLALTPTIQLAPNMVSDAVRERLTEGVRWAKVIRDARPPGDVPTDLAIREVEPAEAQALGEVITAGFGMPPLVAPWLARLVGRDGWRMYGSYDGDQLVGGGALHIDGDVGWLGIGATLPSHRGRGGQRAVMARRMADAIAAACTTLATETGILPGHPNPSLRNMMRSGFEVAYERANWSA